MKKFEHVSFYQRSSGVRKSPLNQDLSFMNVVVTWEIKIPLYWGNISCVSLTIDLVIQSNLNPPKIKTIYSWCSQILSREICQIVLLFQSQTTFNDFTFATHCKIGSDTNPNLFQWPWFAAGSGQLQLVISCPNNLLWKANPCRMNVTTKIYWLNWANLFQKK